MNLSSQGVNSAAELVILDVGHGNAAVVQENARTILIDAAAGSHVLEYLRQRSITSLDLVILSHSDQDHIGGLIAILNAGIRVGLVLLNTDSLKNTAIWEDLLYSLDDARRRGELDFQVGLSVRKLSVDGLNHCHLEIVSPSPALAARGPGAIYRNGKRITTNSISACIRVLYDQKPIAFLAGDIDTIALDDAIGAGTNMEAKLLVFPHHGGLPGADSPEEFTVKLLEAVKPETVIFSHGRAKHDNPNPQIIETIKSSDSSIRVLCTQLSTRCAESLPTQARQYPVFAAGAIKSSCCAGSIVVNLPTSDIDQCILEDQAKFIRDHVPSPLCRIQ